MFPASSFGVTLPGAAGNWQTIDTRWWSPSVTMNFAGDPAVERDVTEEIASYGRQIGWLNDIVAALVQVAGKNAIKGEAAKSLKSFDEARLKIDEIKKRKRQNAIDLARQTLARLKKENGPAYRLLLQSLADDASRD